MVLRGRRKGSLMYRGRVSDMDSPHFRDPEWVRMRTVQSALLRYAEHTDEIIGIEEMLWPAGRGYDTPVVSSGRLSDPTARLAVDLIKVRERMERLRKWNAAIDRLYAQMQADDTANGRTHGISHLMRCLFIEPDETLSPQAREQKLLAELDAPKSYRRWRYRVEDELFEMAYGRPPDIRT